MARHLKEQDDFINLIRSFAKHEAGQPTSLEKAMLRAEELVNAHYSNPTGELRSLVSTMGRSFCRLQLVEALREYDAGTGITARRFVAPSFREIREILNLATVHSVSKDLR